MNLSFELNDKRQEANRKGPSGHLKLKNQGTNLVGSLFPTCHRSTRVSSNSVLQAIGDCENTS